MRRASSDLVGTGPSSARVVGAALVVSIGGSLPSFLTGALAVQLRSDLGLDTTQLGVALGAFGLAAALASVVLGRVVERIGPERSMRIAATVSVAAMAGIAVAATSFGRLVGFLALAGFGVALTNPAVNAFVARGVPIHRHGLAFAIKQSGMPAAALAAGAAVPLLALTVGWRYGFVSGAAIAACGLALVPARRVADARPTPDSTPAFSEPGPTARPPVSHTTLVILSIGVGLGAAAAAVLVGFLVSGAVHVGIAPGAAGWLLTGGSLVGIAVRVRAGVLADRRDGRHLRVVALMLLAGSVGFVLFSLDVSRVYVVATVLAFGTAWAWPGLFNFAIVRIRPDDPGAATGLTQTGVYVGILAGPLIFGAVVDAASYTAGWLLTAGFALAGAATVTLGRRRVRRERRS
ncbi:MAG TPA: MFS transporter [Acidimicrobiia bacterium]|nr:MFS transporter [Acidimicrobiia bacterium]